MTDDEYLKARGWWQTDAASDLWRERESPYPHINNMAAGNWHVMGNMITTVTVYTKEAAIKRQLAADKKDLAGVLEYVQSH